MGAKLPVMTVAVDHNYSKCIADPNKERKSYNYCLHGTYIAEARWIITMTFLTAAVNVLDTTFGKVMCFEIVRFGNEAP